MGTLRPGWTRRAALAATLAAACGGAGDERPPPRAAAAAAAQPAPRYRCAASLAPDVAGTRARLRRDYAAWKAAYVTREGAGGHLRVGMTRGARARTTSEAIGYGMLLAAYLDDRPTLDGLWAYARRHHNRRGLMAWEVDAAGRARDSSAATDGDEDMAFALLVADGRWGGYGAAARALIAALMAHAVEPGTFVFKPGDDWGGSHVLNPSYFAPAYYRAFAAATGDARWLRVVDAGYRVLDAVARKHSPATGLQPEWADARGNPSTADGDFPFHYGYNATRVPWRLAKDAAWHCEPRARRHLERLNAFFRSVGARAMRDGYTLDGRPSSRWHTAAFLGPATAGAMLSPDARYRAEMWAETLRLPPEGYYHDALRLLGMLFASGDMPPPVPRRG